MPVGGRERAQPVRREGGDVVQCRAQRLGHKLQAVEAADGGEHVRAVGALPPARLEQPVLARRVHHPREQPVHGRVAQQPAAELAQHAAVKAGVGEVEREQVLPVDPGTNSLCRLPVAQPLAELHERHQREPPRRIGRLPALRVEIGEVGVSEQRAEPVAQDQVRVAGAERGAGNPGGVVGHGRDRLRGAKRHGHTPG